MPRSFAADFDMRRILTNLQAATGEKIVEGSTLLILDEIQECPRALTSLKYFQEQAPNIHVAAAGSLLGLTVHEGTGFPVGKVNMLDLHPLDFREFLDATGNTMLRELVDEGDPTSINAFGPKLTELLASNIISLEACRKPLRRSSTTALSKARVTCRRKSFARIDSMRQST